MVDHFNYRHEMLHAEGVALEAIAKQIGTPFYCYSRATLERHYQVFAAGLSGLDTQICFAVKANSNLSVLKVLAEQGSGADVVSGGEIRRALAAGIAPRSIVFSGVGKTREEMRYALEHSIWQFNVESRPELEALSEVAHSMNLRAPIAIRINPDVDAGTHAKISTGKAENKFGVTLDEARQLYADALQMKGIMVQGVSMHIGSQLTSLSPFENAYKAARDFVQHLRQQGCSISVLDVGGGLGIPYEQKGEHPPTPESYGALVKRILGDIDCKLVFEPGRLLVGNAGILVSRVIYVKESGSKRFLIVDAAMNDLLRPAMYDAHHELVPVQEALNAAPLHYDIVGPVCETGDTFARDVTLPELKANDLVAFRSAGAYGAVMSCSYNTRPLVPEILVDGDRFAVIRPRQTYEDLLAQDIIADFL